MVRAVTQAVWRLYSIAVEWPYDATNDTSVTLVRYERRSVAPLKVEKKKKAKQGMTDLVSVVYFAGTLSDE